MPAERALSPTRLRDLTEVCVEILLQSGRVLPRLATRFDTRTKLLDERVDRPWCGETRRRIGFLGAHRIPKLAEGFRVEGWVRCVIGIAEDSKIVGYDRAMELDELQRNWDEFGKQDPLWAIRTEPDKRGGKWDLAEFFESGEEHVRELVGRLTELGLPTHGVVLDFGCGVGRLTQAFADHFDDVWGIDIAPSMIEGAEAFNRHGSRVHYVLNDTSDLSRFDDGSFDLVFSVIVLQHIRPDIALSYVREFFRLCRPGGAVVFQIPSHMTSEPFPEGGYAAEITADVPPQLPAGRTVAIPTRVRNAGTTAWPHRPDQFRLGNHWYDGRNRCVEFDSGREPMPVEVPVGATIDLTLQVRVPATPGTHVLELDLVHEGVAWFADRGSPTLKARVQVTRDGAPRRGGVFRRRAQPNAPVIVLDDEPAPDTPDEDQPVMEMHAVHRDEVVALIDELGGTVAAVDRNTNAPPWESYTYYATKDPTRSKNAR
jgi:SAM-dependent methyltransferase